MSYRDVYVPGDPWLYARIYTGCRIADEILLKVIRPLAEELELNGSALRWFFVRYADPDFHLRFRVLLQDPARTAEILASLRSKLAYYIDNRIVWKLELGSYQPEYERYGTKSMGHVEKLFHADSRSFLHFLKEYNQDIPDDWRWKFALVSAHQLLADFGLGPDEKKGLLLGLSRSFGKEFGKDKALARQLSRKYRRYRPQINDLLSGDSPVPFRDILDRRAMECRKEILLIKEMSRAGVIETSLDDLVGSLIHMNMNRIFQARNRLYEMVLYDFLFRHYKSSVVIKYNMAEGVLR